MSSTTEPIVPRVVPPVRKLRNYLFFPSIQLRYAVLFTVLTGAVGTYLIWINSRVDRDIINFINNADNMVLAQDLVAKELASQVMVLIFICTGTFLATVLLTHRFLGPVIGVIRYFESIRTTGKGFIKSRPDDSMAPLINYLQSVEITIKEKKP